MSVVDDLMQQLLAAKEQSSGLADALAIERQQHAGVASEMQALREELNQEKQEKELLVFELNTTHSETLQRKNDCSQLDAQLQEQFGALCVAQSQLSRCEVEAKGLRAELKAAVDEKQKEQQNHAGHWLERAALQDQLEAAQVQLQAERQHSSAVQHELQQRRDEASQLREQMELAIENENMTVEATVQRLREETQAEAQQQEQRFREEFAEQAREHEQRD